MSADPAAIARFEARLSADDRWSEEAGEKLITDFLRRFFRRYHLHVRDLLSRVSREMVEADDAADQITNYIQRETGVVFADDVRGELRRAFADMWRVGGNVRPVKSRWRNRPVPAEAIAWFERANHFDIGKKRSPVTETKSAKPWSTD